MALNGGREPLALPEPREARLLALLIASATSGLFNHSLDASVCGSVVRFALLATCLSGYLYLVVHRYSLAAKQAVVLGAACGAAFGAAIEALVQSTSIFYPWSLMFSFALRRVGLSAVLFMLAAGFYCQFLHLRPRRRRIVHATISAAGGIAICCAMLFLRTRDPGRRTEEGAVELAGEAAARLSPSNSPEYVDSRQKGRGHIVILRSGPGGRVLHCTIADQEIWLTEVGEHPSSSRVGFSVDRHGILSPIRAEDYRK